jgi:hypothetical protein
VGPAAAMDGRGSSRCQNSEHVSVLTTWIIPMTKHKLKLAVLSPAFAVCRLDPLAPFPAWASSSVFTSITRTSDELSVVCQQHLVPNGVQCERNWSCIRVSGKMDFSMIGVVASLVTPLAEAGISVFVVSTFDTDYLLIKETESEMALAALQAAGHKVS